MILRSDIGSSTAGVDPRHEDNANTLFLDRHVAQKDTQFFLDDGYYVFP